MIVDVSRTPAPDSVAETDIFAAFDETVKGRPPGADEDEVHGVHRLGSDLTRPFKLGIQSTPEKRFHLSANWCTRMTSGRAVKTFLFRLREQQAVAIV